mmetsp:Transcript_152645/g.489547  ORF Transcript_152645/g.489547 Transcript_152645/m.489547 type:complete len:112 (+) Transcript_152645:279-614(+)
MPYGDNGPINSWLLWLFALVLTSDTHKELFVDFARRRVATWPTPEDADEESDAVQFGVFDEPANFWFRLIYPEELFCPFCKFAALELVPLQWHIRSHPAAPRFISFATERP